ncbi:MAG: phosphatase PAP2 family protein [Gemmatimonadales bacterium]
MSPLIQVLSRNALLIVLGGFVFLLLVWAAGAILLRYTVEHRAGIRRGVSGILVRLGRRPSMVRLRRRFPRLFGALGRALTLPEYLGLHWVAALIAALGTIGFARLAHEIAGSGRLARLDTDFALALHQTAGPGLQHAMQAVTMLGNGWTLAGMGIIVIAILLLRRRRSLATGMAVALAGAGLLNQALKDVFQRPRPAFAAGMDSWSFPSGHAMGSLVAWGMLAYLGTLVLPRRAARVVVALLVLVVLLIGLSRLYLGVHYLSDILAGYAAGSVWLAMCISATEIARGEEGKT